MIQNATDNLYDDKLEPTVQIGLMHDRVVVKSNEKGFSCRNIQAITGVGFSHKKGISGYIGNPQPTPNSMTLTP